MGTLKVPRGHLYQLASSQQVINNVVFTKLVAGHARGARHLISALNKLAQSKDNPVLNVEAVPGLQSSLSSIQFW